MTIPSQTIPLDEHTMLQLDPDQYDENRINMYFEYHRRLLVLELDETAALMAEVNLRTVHRQLTGVNPMKRVVHCVDTFTLADDDLDRLIEQGWE